MYLVIIAILSIALALRQPLDGWVLVRPREWVLLSVVLATILPPLYAAWMARRARDELEDHTDDPIRGQERFATGMFIVQVLLGLLHGSLLLLTGWMRLCRETPTVGPWPLVPALMAVFPFMLSLVLVWIAVYGVDRTIRQIAVEQYLFRGRPVRPVWSLGGYLVYKLRHELLFILIPTGIIIAARDVIEAREAPLMRVHPHLPDILIGGVAGAVALLAPLLLRFVWQTQPLAPGPLRDRLTELARTLKVRCREILVWRSGGAINAAVIGLFGPLRYVLITDAMLESMEDTRIEAVFGHEAGHVRHHHIPYFLMYALLTGCIVSAVAVTTAQHVPRTGGGQEVVYAGLGLLLLLKWTVGFGWLSHRFERQADIYAVRTLALLRLPCSQPDCRLHSDPRSAGDPRHGPLCATAASAFGDTLNEVAHLNGIPPDAGGLRHPSISTRSRFVQQVAMDPGALRRFDHGVTRLKIVLILCTLAACAWAGWKLKVWTLLDAIWR